MGKLDGKVALITGASAGIGLAIARRFLAEGADVAVVARRGERLAMFADEARQAGRRCAVIVGDAREETTARQAVQTTLDTLGQIDLLVNNAGMGIYAPLVETSADDYDQMMNTNMRSTFLFTRHAVSSMLERGSGTIINVSSMAGVMGFAGEAAYCASKFAQVGFTQALDRELRPRGIKVRVCHRQRAHRRGRGQLGHARSRGGRGGRVADGDTTSRSTHHRDSHAPDGGTTGRARSRVTQPEKFRVAPRAGCGRHRRGRWR
jgi:NAD(P)-dependent dehydrogenase (short-subunit alcohol dehydrogenase family)